MSRIKLLEQEGLLRFLSQIQTGIEREALRIKPNGHLSQESHPYLLGSSLTHPQITTDFSEALTELITPVFQDAGQLLSFLTQLQHFVYKYLPSDEYLWPASMPAILDEHIPIAYYGNSNIAKLKHIYRQGLHHRYGSPMQTIAGLHYNFSLTENFWHSYLHSSLAAEYQLHSPSDGYFHLIRNFRRHAWMLIYWFGASPVFDQTFTHNHVFFQSAAYNTYKPYIKSWGKRSLYCPQATSLRMSALGYRSPNQSAIRLCFNGLAEYIASLYQALQMDCPAYQQLGLMDHQGYKQLNTHLLQMENELYGIIRPKQIAASHERAIHALQKRGVAYLEVRLLDNNPFIPVGIDNQAMHFIQLFLLACLFDKSPAIDKQECNAIEAFQEKIILEGRNPALHLQDKAKPFMELLETLANILDTNSAGQQFSLLCHAYKQQLDYPELTLSGRFMEELQQSQTDYVDLMRDYAYQHKKLWSETPVNVKQQEIFAKEATRSHQLQQALEESDQMDFETFRQNYLAL